MGVQRINGESILEMTEPAGWPDVDEDELRQRMTHARADRATWSTYPVLAVQGWCRHHDKQLRVVVATEEQFANFDPKVAKIIPTAGYIPDDGTMNGRSRLEAIAPDAAQRLNAVADTGLTELHGQRHRHCIESHRAVEVPLNEAPSAHRRLHPGWAAAAGGRSRRAAGQRGPAEGQRSCFGLDQCRSGAHRGGGRRDHRGDARRAVGAFRAKSVPRVAVSLS